MFADVKGSMELLADRDPEETVGDRQRAVALFTKAVEPLQGDLEQQRCRDVTDPHLSPASW
jgi:hypothetical protein